jgi:hypothetical protein
MRTLVLLLAGVVIAACADTHSVNRPSQLSKRMAPSATAYVSVPPDGTHEGKVFPGTGTTTSQIVGAAFARHFRTVERATEPQTLKSALDQAKAKNARYLIAPAILDWQDWDTKNTGRSDHVKVEITVIEVATGETIEHGFVGGTNGIPDWGSDKTQDLLPVPVAEYVDSLFY